MSGFEVTVTDLGAKQLVGKKVRTSMTKAKEDCAALWHSFCPAMQEIAPGHGYGLSVMITEQDFDYWAAAEAPEGPCPAGLETMELPAGAYARCVVPNLESLGAGYMFMYHTWLSSQGDWKLNEQAPCFELYPAVWNPTMPLELFMPVKR